MKTGFVGNAAFKAKPATGLGAIFDGAGLTKSVDDHGFRVPRRQSRLSFDRLELRNWISCRVRRLHLLQFGVRVALGAVLLVPVLAAFALFCVVALCADKFGETKSV